MLIQDLRAVLHLAYERNGPLLAPSLFSCSAEPQNPSWCETLSNSLAISIHLSGILDAAIWRI